MRQSVIKTENLTKYYKSPGSSFFDRKALFTAVDQVSFELYRGEILGLLGESGCGKSTLAGMLMHLIPPSAGKIWMHGAEVQKMPESVFRPRRRKIQMVYQNPFDCLDPSMKIKSLLEEPLKLWFPEISGQERTDRIQRILKECELPDDCLSRYPSEFSGGQLQRLSIARALLVEPEILIADEIISALDVPIQNQILNFLVDIKKKHELSVLFITHDLSVAKKVSDRVMVMQKGRIIDAGKPAEVFSDSADPYISKLEQSVFTFRGRTV